LVAALRLPLILALILALFQPHVVLIAFPPPPYRDNEK
jgi:hypothetical protein